MAFSYSSTVCELLATYNLHGDAKSRLYSLVQKKELGMRVTKSDVHSLDSLLFDFPCTFVMRDFQQHKADKDEWLSEPFYTSAKGYQMCLEVYAMGYGEGRGRCISVVVHLMPGRFDANLKWPFRGTVTIQLLDQSSNNDHITKSVSFTPYTTTRANSERPVRVMNPGVGVPDFATYSTGYSYYERRSQPEYVKDDCLRFRVNNVTVDSMYMY